MASSTGGEWSRCALGSCLATGGLEPFEAQNAALSRRRTAIGALLHRSDLRSAPRGRVPRSTTSRDLRWSTRMPSSDACLILATRTCVGRSGPLPHPRANRAATARAAKFSVTHLHRRVRGDENGFVFSPPIRWSIAGAHGMSPRALHLRYRVRDGRKSVALSANAAPWPMPMRL
jgi:hypothetical protein